MVDGAQALYPVVEKWSVAKGLRHPGGAGCGYRVADDRCHCHTSSSARGGSPGLKRGACLQALGRSKGGNSTKIHLLSESLGLPLRIRLTPGQASDYPQALPLLEGLAVHTVIADRGYDGDALLDAIPNPVIPPKKNRIIQREYDKHLYKERSAIERTFLHLKNFRRVATRYDKLASSFLSFVLIAASLLWLK